MSHIAFEPRLPDFGAARDRVLTAVFTMGFRAARVARRRRLEISLLGGLATVLFAASIISLARIGLPESASTFAAALMAQIHRCPKCDASIMLPLTCRLCGAKMASLNMTRGGYLEFCARRGCKGWRMGARR